MDYKVLEIIHLWGDTREKYITKVIPSQGKIFVFCTIDLSVEAGRVCNFINLVVKRTWTFQVQRENELFTVVFFPETVTLTTLFN